MEFMSVMMQMMQGMVRASGSPSAREPVDIKFLSPRVDLTPAPPNRPGSSEYLDTNPRVALTELPPVIALPPLSLEDHRVPDEQAGLNPAKLSVDASTALIREALLKREASKKEAKKDAAAKKKEGDQDTADPPEVYKKKAKARGKKKAPTKREGKSQS